MKDPSGHIQDLYASLLEEFKEFLKKKIEKDTLREILINSLDRKLIKRLFMPLVYGKTVISMEKDIHNCFGALLSKEDSFNLAKLTKEFWKETYPDIVIFMQMICTISWLVTTKDRAVVYKIPYYTTKQDYMSFDKEQIQVYDKNRKSRKRITMKIPTSNRDRRKTVISTCANFIHQKDAYIAMKVVESLLKRNAPIYTVHDNFLTTPPYIEVVPYLYTQVFIDMGNPLQIINQFIIDNLIEPYINDLGYHPILLADSLIPIKIEDLEDFLLKQAPKSKAEEQATAKEYAQNTIWEKKVTEFIQSYQFYINTVNEANWKDFKDQLQKRITNFSLHF